MVVALGVMTTSAGLDAGKTIDRTIRAFKGHARNGDRELFMDPPLELG
jgi:hypothetical protein